MKEITSLLEGFREAYRRRYSTAEAQKAEGQRVAGWVCTYVPQELLMAAGFYPMRILGGAEETPSGDAHLYSNICSFMRNCLEEAFRGRYQFLDALIGATTCDHKRRLYDAWYKYLPVEFMHILNLPCKVEEASLKFFHAELMALKEGMESHFQLKVTDEALSEAIRETNRVRSRLQRLYEMRKEDIPPLKGSEVLEVVLAGLVSPQEQYLQLLDNLLNQLVEIKRSDNGSLRLMLIGSELDSPPYLKVLEELGGEVVVDDLCIGSKHFMNLVDESGDPMRALAKRYLERNPCPRFHPATQRVANLIKLAREYKVDGAIYQSIKFCELHGGIYPIIKENFAKEDIPILHLEREYLMSEVGQMKTRVQAFFESIGR